MAPPQPKQEAEEDCKVCKKGKKGSAAFGALMAQRGIALPGTPKPGEQPHPPIQLAQPAD